MAPVLSPTVGSLLRSTDLADLSFGHLSHAEMASKARMLMRFDLDFEAVCVGARDRIMWLAHRVAELEARLAQAQAPVNDIENDSEDVLRFPLVDIDYTNYRGERGVRTIQPVRIAFGKTEFHPTEQWLLLAKDVSKHADRTFALKDVHAWSAQPVHISRNEP